MARPPGRAQYGRDTNASPRVYSPDMNRNLFGLLVAGLIGGLLAVPGPTGWAAEREDRSTERPALSPLLWGTLKAGRFRVGFRPRFVRDPSRSWEMTASQDHALQADPGGRPIQFNTWYPAAASRAGRPMYLADYSMQSPTPGYELLSRVMNARADWRVAPTRSEEMRLKAVLGAAPANERFPVVLMFGGLGDDMNSNVVMAEFLASHGMVVVSVSLLGPSSEDTGPSGGSDGVETTVRDMEYVLSIVRRYAYVDSGRVAALGHSIGAVQALVLAARSGLVATVVGLDGTYGFKGLAQTVTGAVGFNADRFAGALLDARRAEGVGGAELDNTVLESLRYGERWQVALPQMQHNDFTSRAETGVLAFRGAGLPSAVLVGKSGYEFVCTLVKDFLAWRFGLGGESPFDRWNATGSAAVGFRHLAKEALPLPARSEWAGIISKGLEAIESRLHEECRGEPLDTCGATSALAAVGGELGARGEFRQALVVSQVIARAKPRSVFAQDGLADSYKAVGDWANYRKAVERAIQLVPVDPNLSAETAPSFVLMEQDKLDRLPPQAN